MSILDDLATELGVSSDTLRSALTGESGEVLQPIYLTIDGQGKVSAQFSGHVTASGLDLTTAKAPVAPATINMIQWLLNNVVTSRIYGWDTANSPAEHQNGLVINSLFTSDDPNSLANINVLTNDKKTPFNQIQIEQKTTGLDQAAPHNSLAVRVTEANVTTLYRLILGDGSSDWVQWGPWTALPLNATNWQNQPGGQPAQYRSSLTPAGTRQVELRGSVQSKTAIGLGFVATGLIASLPAILIPSTNDQIRLAAGTDPGIGACVWGIDAATPGGGLWVFREHTGRAPSLAIGVIVDISMSFSTA